ncbi:MAG: diguanylate cyclase, partial [Thiovulaceae bacterium]|nr:diguanylate cyclase [Sulfurimonadaceae bacterium]
EFFILLARCDIVKSREVSNRILTFISQYDFSSKRKITVSIGVTQFRDSDTPASLIERSDNALYDAKKSGRNQVCFL